MKHLLFWAVTLLLWSHSAFAGECDELAHRMHRAALEGEPVMDIPSSCLGTIQQPPEGSGNWPIMLRGALYVSGRSDGKDLLPWLRGGTVWGHNGREGGSTIYEAWNTGTALAVRWRAAESRDAELEREASRWLRALWAKYALAATPNLPQQIRFWQHGQKHERSRLSFTGYQGPMVHLVGNRQGEDPERGEKTGSWVELHAGHALLAWAADWPGRRYEERYIQPDALGGALWTVQQVTGRSFGNRVDPSVFGLTEEERRTLRAFLQEPTELQPARAVAAWLDDYPFRSRQTVTFRRYQSGAILTVLSGTFNANKSGAVAVLGETSRSTWLLPSAYAGVKAATARGVILDQRVAATSNDGGRLELDLSNLGEIAWEGVWSSGGVLFAGSPHQKSVARRALIAQESANEAELEAVLSAIYSLASRHPSSSSAMLQTTGELIRRLDGWSQADGDRRQLREEVAKALRRLEQQAEELEP